MSVKWAGPLIMTEDMSLNHEFRIMDNETFGMTVYNPIKDILTEEGDSFDEEFRVSQRRLQAVNKGQCSLGVYWILANTNQCSDACQAETVSYGGTECAGDYPDYNGWPFSSSDVNAVLSKMDLTRYPKLKSCLSDKVRYTAGTNDDMTPMVQVRSSFCVVFYHHDTSLSQHQYKCNGPIPSAPGIQRLCPCCIGGK